MFLSMACAQGVAQKAAKPAPKPTSKPTAKPTTECSPALDSALELSGFRDSVQSMPEMVQQQMEMQAQKQVHMPDDVKVKLIGLVTDAFSEDKIMSSIKRKFVAQCDAAMLQSAVKQLQGTTAQKIRQQEALAMTKEGQKDAPEYFRTLLKTAPDQTRVALLERMDKDLAITDSTLDMMMAMSSGLAAGFGGPASSSAEIDGLKAQYRPQIHNSMIANQLFTYRNLSDKELEQYVAMYETPAMQNFSMHLSKGMTEVFSEQMQTMAKEFKKFLDENPALLQKDDDPVKSDPNEAAPDKSPK